MAVGSQDFGVWDMPWYAVYKLKTQESWWCHSVWVWRPGRADSVTPRPITKACGGRGSAGASSGVWRPKNQELWCQWAGEDGYPSSRKEREGLFALPLPFCSICTLNSLDVAGLHGEGGSSLLTLWIQMLMYLWRTLTDRHNQKYCFANYLGIS